MSRAAVAVIAVLALFGIATPARAQQPRRIALTYQLATPPLFAPNGEPREGADGHVDALLRTVRSLETDHADDTLALAFNGVVCDELRLLATPRALRVIAALERLARNHRILRTPYASTRLEHLGSDDVAELIDRGDEALVACTAAQPRDPVFPPDVSVPSAVGLESLFETGVRSVVSAFATPPTTSRPTVIPAVVPRAEDTEADLFASRPETQGLAIVLGGPEGLPLLGRIVDDDRFDVVEIGDLEAIDVISGAIDQPVDPSRSHTRAIARAAEALAHFRSYTLPDNRLAAIYETVLARAASTSRRRFDDMPGEERADRLHDELSRANSLVTVSAGSVTFTSRHGSVPVTISNRARYAVRIRLVLSSPKLDFGGGEPRIVTSVTRIDPPGDTVTFDAVARSSGTFPVGVVLQSPDGKVFDRAQVTVRSTAANLSAVVLTGGGALFLIYWLFRRRRQRREHEAA